MSGPGGEALDEALRESGRVERQEASFDEQLMAHLLPSFSKVGEKFGNNKRYRFSTEFEPHEDGSVTFSASSLIVVSLPNSKA